MQVEIAFEGHAIIGESPTWDAEAGLLYWIDVKRPAFYVLDPKTGKNTGWTMPSDIGAFCLVSQPKGAIVALRQGIHRLSFEDGSLSLLADPPFDTALFRFNEGGCDLKGRFWVGVMFDPIQGVEAPPAKASLHRFTLAAGLVAQPDAAELHNGMAWSRDGQRLFLSHSYQREIFTFDFDPEQGRISNRTVFARVSGVDGIPDGAAIDESGGYWCALHGAGRLRRYTPNGEVDRDVALPVSQPTMCSFGGDGMKTLYVTTASDGLTPEQLESEPLAGAILCLRPGEKGLRRDIYLSSL